MTYRICLLAGDGIGPEVIDLRALPLGWEFARVENGFGASERLSSPLPGATPDTIRSIRHASSHPNIELHAVKSCQIWAVL